MKVEQYLQRINLNKPATELSYNAGSRDKSLSNLKTLIKYHVSHIPFENFDVLDKVEITLGKDKLFNKIVQNNRGGFCYELNYSFYNLLIELNYPTKIIAGEVYRINGTEVGPPFDHMSLIVTIEHQEYLIDVGFIEGSIIPLGLDNLEQEIYDGYSIHRIRKDNDAYYLEIKTSKSNWLTKIRFNNEPRMIEDFYNMCKWQQTENEVFALPFYSLLTDKGRKSCITDKFITSYQGIRNVEEIKSPEHRGALLEEHFGLKIPGPAL